MSEQLPVLKAKEVVRITIPMHAGDLPKPVLRSILKQAQLIVEELNALR